MPEVIPESFKIPDTIEGVHALLKARKWQKAAIVWAYVDAREHAGQPAKSIVKTDNKPYTPETFAAEKVVGLLSKNTVQAYWENWQYAIDKKKAKPVKVGDFIAEPQPCICAEPVKDGVCKKCKGLNWPPTDKDPRKGTAGRHVSDKTVVEAIKENPELLRELIRDNPQAEKFAFKAIVEKQAEKREKFREERIAAGVDPDVFDKPSKPVWKDTALDNLMEAAVDEAGRREALRGLMEYAEKGRDAMAKLVEDQGQTGVPDEVDWLHRMNSALTDWEWAAVGFIHEDVNQESM